MLIKLKFIFHSNKHHNMRNILINFFFFWEKKYICTIITGFAVMHQRAWCARWYGLGIQYGPLYLEHQILLEKKNYEFVTFTCLKDQKLKWNTLKNRHFLMKIQWAAHCPYLLLLNIKIYINILDLLISLRHRVPS